MKQNPVDRFNALMDEAEDNWRWWHDRQNRRAVPWVGQTITATEAVGFLRVYDAGLATLDERGRLAISHFSRPKLYQVYRQSARGWYCCSGRGCTGRPRARPWKRTAASSDDVARTTAGTAPLRRAVSTQT